MLRLRHVILTTVALLAGCGGAANSTLSPSRNLPLATSKGSQTFSYTGARQTFIVPSGVASVTIAASGATGSQCSSSCYGYGAPGTGAKVKATIPVTAGETLVVLVGGDNGYNGGGSRGSASAFGVGGGASDVRQGGDGLRDRVIVAGGGGGGGYVPYSEGVGGGGGQGGGRAGSAGGTGFGYLDSGTGGSGGTQRAGGKGGAGGTYGPAAGPLCVECGSCSGKAGAHGRLGYGGDGATYCGGPGGGGGGGYYGGGGGGSGASSYYRVSFQLGAGGGGGGGSSFIEKGALNVRERRGAAPAGNGQVVISW